MPDRAVPWLLDDFGHEIEPIGDGRRIALYQIALVAFGHDIRPETLRLVQWMRHGDDIVGRRLLQLSDEIDNTRQLGDDVVELVFCQLQASELSDVLNLFFA